MATSTLRSRNHKNELPSKDNEASAEEDLTRDFPLSKLHLDGKNPRLGTQAGKTFDEVALLDTIVNVFGVDDLLSSLAVNGYFAAEPMVGVRRTDGGISIAEGNRRLAACLILAGDKRARNQKKRTGDYQSLQQRYERSAITQVPVRILADSQDLLSYLGVRHIAASQPWDSFAKAAWVAKVLDESDFSLEDVSRMIGDQHRTVARSLEGYNLVNQLIEMARFNPEDSERPGRGSNTEYPFSWVYTALGYSPIREWLGLADLSLEGRDKKPLKGKQQLDDAADLMVFLFGKRNQRRAAISDSRQISDLARAVANPESRRLLKRGKSVEDVDRLLKPIRERVSDSLLDAQDALRNASEPLAQGEVNAREAAELMEPRKKVKNLATEVHIKVVDAAKD